MRLDNLKKETFIARLNETNFTVLMRQPGMYTSVVMGLYYALDYLPYFLPNQVMLCFLNKNFDLLDKKNVEEGFNTHKP